MPESTGKASRALFIAASVVQILTFAMKAIGQVAEPLEIKGDSGRQLTDLMGTVPIELPGSRRTMLALFNGFGWHFALSLLALGVIGLVVARGDARARRSFAAAAAVFMAAFTVNSVVLSSSFRPRAWGSRPCCTPVRS